MSSEVLKDRRLLKSVTPFEKASPNLISTVSHTRATLSSYVDAIIAEHLRAHASLLAEIHADATEELLDI